MVSSITIKRRVIMRLTILFILAGVIQLVIAQNYDNRNNYNRRPFPGLQRSQSDPRLNRNSTYNFRRQSYSRRDQCHTNYKFDYVALTLQWAPGVCSTSPQQCQRENNKHFTIHGMWPTIRGTQEPDFCCFDNTFDYKALEPLTKDLDEYWFSYYGGANSKSFLAHEWLKHGTCARDIQALKGEQRYFGTTLAMAKQLPIIQALAQANIVPSNGKPYLSADVVKALMPLSGGKTIQINCDFEHHQPTPLITGLSFCYDANLKPSDCPEMRRKCQKQLIFPASSTYMSN